jgi:hypothetical protein
MGAKASKKRRMGTKGRKRKMNKDQGHVVPKLTLPIKNSLHPRMLPLPNTKRSRKNSRDSLTIQMMMTTTTPGSSGTKPASPSTQEEEEELDMTPPHDANAEVNDPDVSLLITDEMMELEDLREMISSRAPTPEVPDNWETLAEDEDTMPYHPMNTIEPLDLFSTTTAELHLNPNPQLTPISPWSQTQVSEISEAYQLHLITPENYTMLSGWQKQSLLLPGEMV